MGRSFNKVVDVYDKHVADDMKRIVSTGKTLLQQAYDAGVIDGAMSGVPWNEDKSEAPYRVDVFVTTVRHLEDEDEDIYDVAMGRCINRTGKSSEWLVNGSILDDDEIVAWTDAIKPYNPNKA